jgi:hypothetical protein
MSTEQDAASPAAAVLERRQRRTTPQKRKQVCSDSDSEEKPLSKMPERSATIFDVHLHLHLHMCWTWIVDGYFHLFTGSNGTHFYHALRLTVVRQRHTDGPYCLKYGTTVLLAHTTRCFVSQ